jgi:hypothetical protein
MDQKDLEKLTMLESIQERASHCIDQECLHDCPYDDIISTAIDVLRGSVHSDIARELGLPDMNRHCRKHQ